MQEDDDKLYSKALELELHGKLDEAEKLYKEIISRNPSHERARHRLSIIQNKSEGKSAMSKIREEQEKNKYILITSANGKVHQHPIGDSVVVGIRTGEGRHTKIDLSALTFWPDLHDFNLQGAIDIKNLDLSPLSDHANLHRVSIRCNHLGDFDLSVFSTCPSLQRLSLKYNGLSRLDLSPLCSCPIFKQLDVGRNHIEHLDITPVIMQPFLEVIALKDTVTVDDQDISLSSWIDDPYSSEREIRTTEEKTYRGQYPKAVFSVDPPAPKGTWELLHKLASIPQRRSIAIQTYILRALGLESFGLIDSDISDFLRSIPPQTSLDEVKEILKPHLAGVVSDQIDNGGTTIGMNVPELIDEIGDITYRIDRITEMREDEIALARTQRLSISPDEDMIDDDDEIPHESRFDISQIALTAYGFAILTALGKIGMEKTEKRSRLGGTIPSMRVKPPPPSLSLWFDNRLQYDGLAEKSMMVGEHFFKRMKAAMKKLGFEPKESGGFYTESDYISYWYKPTNMSVEMMQYIRGVVMYGWPNMEGWK